jgi:hypothetical protein
MNGYMKRFILFLCVFFYIIHYSSFSNRVNNFKTASSN